MNNNKFITKQWITVFLRITLFIFSRSTLAFAQNINLLMQQTKGDTLLPNFYHWMERNSYICEAGAVFLSEPEAIQFNCAALCGEPMETFSACARKKSNEEPNCEQVPELCVREFIQEFVLALGETRGEIFLQDFSLSQLISQRDSRINKKSVEQLIVTTTEEPSILISTTPTTTKTASSPSSSTTSSSTTTQTTTTTPTTTKTRSTTTSTSTTTTRKPSSTIKSTISTTIPSTTSTISTVTTSTPSTTTTSKKPNTFTTELTTKTSTPTTTIFSSSTKSPTTNSTVGTSSSTPSTTLQPVTDKLSSSSSSSGPVESGTSNSSSVDHTALVAETVDGDVLANNSTANKSDKKDRKTAIGKLLEKFNAVVSKPAEPFFESVFRGKLLPANSKKGCLPDGDASCEFWARVGECMQNPRYMLTVCKRACGVCQPQKPVQNEIRAS